MGTIDPETLNKTGKGGGFRRFGQPSPEKKSAGWNRKRIANEMMDDIVFNSDMTMEEFKNEYMQKETYTYRGKEYEKRVPKDSLTIRDRQIILYMFNIANTESGSLNRMDRHVPMAPQKFEIGEDSEKDNVDDILAKKAKDEILNLRSKKSGSSVG